MLINFPFIEKSHIYYVRMRNPKLLKTGPEFYKTQIFLEDSLLILTNIQKRENYRLYSHIFPRSGESGPREYWF